MGMSHHYCTHRGVRGPLWAKLLAACFGKVVSVPLCCIGCEPPSIQVSWHAMQRLLPEMLAYVVLSC